MAGIITLSILGAILALIVIFLLIKVSLIIQYDDGVTLKLRILFITVRLYPEKEKKRRKNPLHKRMWSYAKHVFKLPKRHKKSAKKEADDGKKRASASTILETIQTVCIIVKEVVSKFAKHLRIKIAKINIKLATGDAAQTAIAYGALTQSINVLFPLLEDIKNFSMPKNKDINISPDFLSEESEMELKLVFSLRVWQILSTAISILYKLIIHSIKSLERKERKNHGN